MSLRLGNTTRRLDAEAIEQGVTKECPVRPGLLVTYLPAATFNRRFKRALSKRPKEPGSGNTRADFIERCGEPEVIVDGLVTNVEGVFDEKGEAVEYTPEIGLQIFSDPSNADVVEWMVSECITYGQFYTKEVIEDSGNSGSGSSGKRAGAGKSKKTKS